MTVSFRCDRFSSAMQLKEFFGGSHCTDINLQKKQFSYAHIYAIATAAGYSFQLVPSPLNYDAIITGRDETNLIRYPRLALQVRSTSAEILSTESIRYPLLIKNYGQVEIAADPKSPRLEICLRKIDQIHRKAD